MKAYVIVYEYGDEYHVQITRDLELVKALNSTIKIPRKHGGSIWVVSVEEIELEVDKDE